ncbi:hypothetical protein A2Z41_02880 [Microgenomates group bacterium RBG_19FT_COMBO_39_10]|nr:MAG: hypothetical protein A2Z41_02880 [Microgenomates group bacterium RBG_19FT_COMBO_39_10]
MSERQEGKENLVKSINVPGGAVIHEDFSFSASRRLAGEDGERLPWTTMVNAEQAAWFGEARGEWVPTVPGRKKPRVFYGEDGRIIKGPKAKKRLSPKIKNGGEGEVPDERIALGFRRPTKEELRELDEDPVIRAAKERGGVVAGVQELGDQKELNTLKEPPEKK